MAKQRRNAKCACGSGKKYKHCCLTRDEEASLTGSIDALLNEASELVLSPDRSERDEAERSLRRLASDPRATDGHKLNAAINLVINSQHRGDHVEALRQIDAITDATPETELLKKHLRAISLTQLGAYEDAAALYDTLLATPQGQSKQRSGWWELEAGRTYSLANRLDDAIRVTKSAVAFFEEIQEREHSLRARSNLAIFSLKSRNPDEVQQAENFLERAWALKLDIGDPEGASTNFSQLSFHYLRLHRWEKAIAYSRRDLKLSRLLGNDRLTGSSLTNIASIYLHALQLSEARNAIREAERIGKKLGNPDLLETCGKISAQIERVGRRAGESKLPIGKAAPCACKSGKKYIECCGLADHEPMLLRLPVGGPTEDIDAVREVLEEAGLEPLHLDYAMRESEQSRERVSWSQFVGHDGWIEMLEMPDMANMHLNAAEALAERAEKNPDGQDEPIACAMLTVSALEAFINSTIYFASEAAKKRAIALPADLQSDAAKYQRHTELTLKWHELGASLCVEWPPPTALWEDFKKLVQLRNELVHYKAEGFTSVMPMEGALHEYLRNLPREIELRDVPRSWPIRLLTPSFARWTVTVTIALIRYFRSQYKFGLSVLKSTEATGKDEASTT